jgi:hypothetical protein
MTSVIFPGWVEPSYSAVYIPDLPSLGLSQDERDMVSRLSMRSYRLRAQMLLTDAYYRGNQIINNLGIALPPELDNIRVIIGWPRIAVDPYIERLQLDSFRLSNSTIADQTLTDLRIRNGLDSEDSLAFTEALVMGRAYYTLSRDEDDGPGDLPDVHAESPLNIAVEWDIYSRKPKAVLQSYWDQDRRHAALYLPEQTVFIAQDDKAEWQVTHRDQHGFGFVPVIRMPNRPRASARDGSSEITTELMSITDAACRTLLNLTAASEFYSVPQKLILGATEDDFIASDGSKKTAWETYIGRVLALQRDSEGALPQVHQFQAYDPSVFTKVIEMYASQASGILGAPPQDLGLYTQGNPVSAEAYQVSEARRDRRTRNMQQHFGCGLIEVAQMAMRFMNGGELPAGYDRIAADWRDPQIVNFPGMSDGLAKLMAEGAVPRGNDVVLRKLGFNAIEREQMLKQLDEDPGMKIINSIGTAVVTKAIRATSVLANAGQTQAAPGA